MKRIFLFEETGIGKGRERKRRCSFRHGIAQSDRKKINRQTETTTENTQRERESVCEREREREREKER